MKVNLLISDDEELRSAIKEMIQAEVKSIVRSSVRQILGDVIQEKVAPSAELDKIIRAEISAIVAKCLYPQYQSNEVKVIAREEIQKYLEKNLGMKINIT